MLRRRARDSEPRERPAGGVGAADEPRPEAGSDEALDEALMGTFPASDPIAVPHPRRDPEP